MSLQYVTRKLKTQSLGEDNGKDEDDKEEQTKRRQEDDEDEDEDEEDEDVVRDPLDEERAVSQ